MVWPTVGSRTAKEQNTRVANRQTHKQTDHATMLCIAMQPNNNIYNDVLETKLTDQIKFHLETNT